MKYKLAIFDLDGTILNTLQDLSNGVNYSLKINNLPNHTTEEIRMMIGNGIKCLIRRAIPHNSSETCYQKVYTDFVNYYTNHCTEKTKPYNGIKECLQKLKDSGVILALNTNKNEEIAKIMCLSFFPNIFDIIVGSKEGTRPKPQIDGVIEIMSSLSKKQNKYKLCFWHKNKMSSWYKGLCKKQFIGSTVYIGDTDVDIQTGKNANIDTIGITWGFRNKDFLMQTGATKVIDTPEELYKYIVE